jgi:hypothetical protein
MNKKVLIILGSAAVFLLLCGLCGVGFVVFALPMIPRHWGGSFSIEGAPGGPPDKRLVAERVERFNQMKVIGIAVHNVIDALHRGPSNMEELTPYLPVGDPLSAEALKRLRKGDIQIVWMAAPQQVEGNSRVLIAWEARPDASGNRVVLYVDGRPGVILTEQEFQTKPKAHTVK